MADISSSRSSSDADSDDSTALQFPARPDRSNQPATELSVMQPSQEHHDVLPPKVQGSQSQSAIAH